MKLSIFLAGIRASNWLNLYHSISGSTTIQDYELVIVSPYNDNEVPKFVLETENVKHIRDRGCPTRCYQLGLLNSVGEYVIWVADDGVFVPNLAIDQAFELLPKKPKGIVTLRYFEGEVTAKSKQQQEPDSFWRMGVHKILNRLPYVPPNYFLIMIGLMRRDYLMEMGGWDCRFEQPGLSCVDLSARLQNDGADVVLGPKCQNVDHGRGVDRWGIDHMPIERAHKENDKPLFMRVYRSPQDHRIRIDVNNWQTSPPIWRRRFGKLREK